MRKRKRKGMNDEMKTKNNEKNSNVDEKEY